MKAFVKPAGQTLGLATAAVALATAAQAASWDMPTPYSAREFHTRNVMEFAKDVAAATKGKLTIKVHPGASLIKHPEIPKAIRSGQVPIGEFLLSILANDNPVFGVDSVPGLATDYAQAKKLWDASRSAVAKAPSRTAANEASPASGGSKSKIT